MEEGGDVLVYCTEGVMLVLEDAPVFFCRGFVGGRIECNVVQWSDGRSEDSEGFSCLME